MFLDILTKRNEPLARQVFALHRRGDILPDTFVLDLDTIEHNAGAMLDTARQHNVKLYYMLKQLGRNPLVARRLDKLGFAGSVCVDYREAQTMIDAGVRLGHVGHLVQLPKAAMADILRHDPEVVMLFSLEKARELDAACKALGRRQDVLLRFVGPKDFLYLGQYGGFLLSELEQVAEEINRLPNLRIAGVCTFPCLMYDAQQQDILPLPNCDTVREAAARLRALGFGPLQVNMPSATCSHSIPLIAQYGGTHGEPGHGLSGTTPYHADHLDAVERPAVLYVSEISHNYGGNAYCYGGGYYRRGHLKHALVGSDYDSAARTSVHHLNDDVGIDYHLELDGEFAVSDTVVMCFRSQIFTTRSEVAVVSGLSGGAPVLEGIWSALGKQLR